VLDLPGAYSLTPTTLDEAITRDLLLGRLTGEAAPRFIVCVTDATNLRLNLRLVLEIKNLGIPMIVALNMSDLARTRGYQVDATALERELEYLRSDRRRGTRRRPSSSGSRRSDPGRAARQMAGT
jgi:ferrous iron transport protein B